MLFELFTQALWQNNNLQKWAYLYLDVSWIITIGWSTIIVVSTTIIDLYFNAKSELQRFILYLVPITIIGVVAEAVVLSLKIRQYPQEIMNIFSGYTLFGIVPVETLYYIPVFMALVISFSRYWEISFGNALVSFLKKSPQKKRSSK